MLRPTLILLVTAALAGPALALYDAKPDEALAASQGAWTGSLTYRDYSQPDRLVALPVKRFVALAGPDVLELGKHEVPSTGEPVFRNRYVFRR